MEYRTCMQQKAYQRRGVDMEMSRACALHFHGSALSSKLVKKCLRIVRHSHCPSQGYLRATQPVQQPVPVEKFGPCRAP
eukprot:6213436-Pleurochrysis_carterae.AAC.9